MNKHLFTFRIKDNKFCSYYFTEEETIMHIFVYCPKIKILWNELKLYLNDSIYIPTLNPQSAIFGFFQVDPNLVLILNYILLLFKYYIYITRDSHKLSLAALIKMIRKVYFLGKIISEKNTKRFEKMF